MIQSKRKPKETRKETVRRQFREQALRLAPNPGVVPLDGRGLPRRKPHYSTVTVKA
jgi:hypothetical protein